MSDDLPGPEWEPPEEMAPIFAQVGDALSALVSPGKTVDDLSAVLFEQVRQWGWPHAWVMLQCYGWQLCHGVACPCAVAHPWIEQQLAGETAAETAGTTG